MLLAVVLPRSAEMAPEPASTAPLWIFYALTTVGCWGVYGVLLHTGQVGIYIGQNSRDVTIDSVEIVDAFSGIYLEAGSKGTLIPHRMPATHRT